MKRLGIAIALVLVLSLAMIPATPVAAATPIYVNGTTGSDLNNGQTPATAVKTIGKGITVVDAGGTVNVAAGTYNEQAVINKSLTLQGAGNTTIIQPTQITANGFTNFTRNGGGLTAGIIAVNAGGASVTVKNLKVDGGLILANGPVGSPFRAASSLVGIFYRDSAGLIEGVTVEAIKIKNASAILLTSVSAASPSVTVEVRNSRVTKYLKNGITATGPNISVNIQGNTVTGSAPVSYIAQNGIQVSYGSTGVVHRNKVDGNWYTGLNWTASGILVFESNEVSVQGNTVSGSQSGIAIETWGWIAPSADNNKVVNNTVTGATWGVTVAAVGFPRTARPTRRPTTTRWSTTRLRIRQEPGTQAST